MQYVPIEEHRLLVKTYYKFGVYDGTVAKEFLKRHPKGCFLFDYEIRKTL